MIGVKRFKVDDGSSSGSGGSTSFSSGGSFANGFLEITANSSNKSGIDLHTNNPSPGLNCLLCLNGTAGQAYTADFAIISKTLNVVGSNTQKGTTATSNMYGATETIGSQDAQIICTGGNSSAVITVL